MATTKKTEMLENGVSEEPTIREAELNGYQQDDSEPCQPSTPLHSNANLPHRNHQADKACPLAWV